MASNFSSSSGKRKLCSIHLHDEKKNFVALFLDSQGVIVSH